jgi:hypothetical protein
VTFRCTAACTACMLAVLTGTGSATGLASLTQRNVLTDDWWGQRSALAQRGIGIELYTGAGLVYMGPPGRPADQTGIGVAAAHNGSPFEHTAPASGLAPADAEIALEWTYRAVLTPWLALQPDFQYIIHPGGLISRLNAVVIGLRSEIDF